MYTNWDQKLMGSIATLRWYPVKQVVEYLHSLRKYVICTSGKFSATYLPLLGSPCPSNTEAAATAQSEQDDSDASDTEFSEQRDESSTTLKKSSTQLPAAKDRRFPDETFYFCESNEEFGQLTTQLALMSHILVDPKRLERKYPGITTQGELEEKILLLVQQTLKAIDNRSGIMNRDEFEKRYGLHWSATATADGERAQDVEAEDAVFFEAPNLNQDEMDRQQQEKQDSNSKNQQLPPQQQQSERQVSTGAEVKKNGNQQETRK